MIKVQRDREKVGEAQKTSVHRLSLPDLLTKLAENYCQRNAEGLFDYMIFKNLLKYVDFIIHRFFSDQKNVARKLRPKNDPKKNASVSDHVTDLEKNLRHKKDARKNVKNQRKGSVLKDQRVIEGRLK